MDLSFCVAPSTPDEVLFSDKVTRSHCMCCTRRFHVLRKKVLCFNCNESVCLECIAVWQPKNQQKTEVLCKRCIHKHTVLLSSTTRSKSTTSASSLPDTTVRWSFASSSSSNLDDHDRGRRHASSEEDVAQVAPLAADPSSAKGGLILSPRQLRAVESKRCEQVRPCTANVSRPRRAPTWHTN